MAFTKGQSGNPKGRPKGSTTRPNLLSYVTEEQIKEFIEFTVDNYKEDSRLHTWFGDQIFGKAQQSVDMTSGGKPLLISSNDE